MNSCINEELIDLTISGQKKKAEQKPVKVKVRPVVLKNKIEYQVSEYIGTKVFHKNYGGEEVKQKI